MEIVFKLPPKSITSCLLYLLTHKYDNNSTSSDVLMVTDFLSLFFLSLVWISDWNTKVENVVLAGLPESTLIPTYTLLKGAGPGHSLPPSFLWSCWQCQQNAADIGMDICIVTLRGDTVKLLSMCDAHSWSFHRVFSFPWQVISTYISYILP